MTTPYEPELGQMLFGNASGEYDLGADERYVTDKLYELSKRLGELDPEAQAHGLLGGEWGYGQEYKNDVFEMHPYYWGDCTCGFEAADWEWSEAHDHTPQCFNTRYRAEEDRLRQEDLGFEEESARMTAWAQQNGYADAPYGMAVHCDCGHDEEYAKWRETHDHVVDCPTVLPNFRCGTVSLSFYKYVGRGMSVNRPVSRDEWKRLFKACFASLPATPDSPPAAS